MLSPAIFFHFRPLSAAISRFPLITLSRCAAMLPMPVIAMIAAAAAARCRFMFRPDILPLLMLSIFFAIFIAIAAALISIFAMIRCRMFSLFFDVFRHYATLLTPAAILILPLIAAAADAHAAAAAIFAPLLPRFRHAIASAGFRYFLLRHFRRFSLLLFFAHLPLAAHFSRWLPPPIFDIFALPKPP